MTEPMLNQQTALTTNLAGSTQTGATSSNPSDLGLNIDSTKEGGN